MDIKEKSTKLNLSITRLSNLDQVDKEELESILKFGQNAIGCMEKLVDEVLRPLLDAKEALYKNKDINKANEFLIKIATDFYEELDEARNMLSRFQKLSDNFDSEIKPILSKYYGMEEVLEWGRIINSSYMSRAEAYEEIETFIPKIDSFITTKHNTNLTEILNLETVRGIINNAIEDLRVTKKDLQSVQANFLQLSGINGLTNVSESKLLLESRKNEIRTNLEKIEKLVASSRIDTALEDLKQLCSNNYLEMVDDVILLQARYSENIRKFYVGIDNDETTLNSINSGILKILEEIKTR